MSTILTKLKTKSKLWAAIAGVLVGVATIFGLDSNTISIVSGAVIAVGSVITYIVTEGKIDVAAVSAAAQKVEDAVAAVSEPDSKKAAGHDGQ